MKKYQIELSAAQVIVLFEMCEHCSTVIHAANRESEEIPENFGIVMGIQSKLDGCEEMNMDKVSLLEQAQSELGVDGKWWVKEFQNGGK